MSHPISNPTTTHALAQRTAAWGTHTGERYAPYQARAAALAASDGGDGSGDDGHETPPAAPVARVRSVFAQFSAVAVALVLAAAGVAGYPVYQQWAAGLALGHQVAGLEIVNDNRHADLLASQLHVTTGATSQMAGAYADPARPTAVVLIAAGKRLTWRPDVLVDRALPVAGAYRARTGGGYLRCAPVPAGTEGTNCVWADHGTVVYAIFRERTVPDAVSMFGPIRKELIVRG